jgi:hypothetical protein
MFPSPPWLTERVESVFLPTLTSRLVVNRLYLKPPPLPSFPRPILSDRLTVVDLRCQLIIPTDLALPLGLWIVLFLLHCKNNNLGHLITQADHTTDFFKWKRHLSRNGPIIYEHLRETPVGRSRHQLDHCSSPIVIIATTLKMAIINQAFVEGAIAVARQATTTLASSTVSAALSSDTGSTSIPSATSSFTSSFSSTSTIDPAATSTSINPGGTQNNNQNNNGTSSPLLFFVALGFGVVFTNLW